MRRIVLVGGICLSLCLIVSPAAADLTFDLRLQSAVDTKAKTVAVGDVLTLGLYALVMGTNGLNDEGFTFGWGSILATGSSSSAVGGNLSTGNNISPFDGLGSQPGTQADLNGDGFLDVGSNSTSQNANFIHPRTSAPATSGTRIGSNSEEFFLSTFIYTVTSATALSTTTSLNFRVTDFVPDNQRIALFQTDGSANDETNALINVGAPVVLNAVPEPSSFLLLGFCAFVRMSRRDRRDR